jgi:hypothetical protein
MWKKRGGANMKKLIAALLILQLILSGAYAKMAVTAKAQDGTQRIRPRIVRIADADVTEPAETYTIDVTEPANEESPAEELETEEIPAEPQAVEEEPEEVQPEEQEEPFTVTVTEQVFDGHEEPAAQAGPPTAETAEEARVETRDADEPNREETVYGRQEEAPAEAPPPDPAPEQEAVPEEDGTAAPGPEADPEPEQAPADDPVPAPPAFDIDSWTDLARQIALEYGLELDASATYCWDNPVSANASCRYIERDLRSRLGRYAGDPEITRVWIWHDDLGNGKYHIYIGYA